MTDAELAQWSDWSKRDDWHTLFVASDIRQMIGEIERLHIGLRLARQDMKEAIKHINSELGE